MLIEFLEWLSFDEFPSFIMVTEKSVQRCAQLGSANDKWSPCIALIDKIKTSLALD